MIFHVKGRYVICPELLAMVSLLGIFLYQNVVIIIIISSSSSIFSSFSHQRKLMVYHWSLIDSKSPQIPRTLRSILGDLNKFVVRMVSTCSLFLKIQQSLC